MTIPQPETTTVPPDPAAPMSDPLQLPPLPNQTDPDPAVRGTAAFTAVVTRDRDSGVLMAKVPGYPGAHAYADTAEDLRANLTEVLGMLLIDGAPDPDCEAVDLMTVDVPVPLYDPLPRPIRAEDYPAPGDDDEDDAEAPVAAPAPVAVAA